MADVEYEIAINKAIACITAQTKFDISPAVQDAYVECLSTIPSETLMPVLRGIFKKGLNLPTIEKIEEMCGITTNTPENDAIEAVNRIEGAMYMYPAGDYEKAREHIGELGWTLVKSLGGWSEMHRSVTISDFKYAKRDWVKLLKNTIRKALLGETSPPALPMPRQGLMSAGSLLNGGIKFD